MRSSKGNFRVLFLMKKKIVNKYQESLTGDLSTYIDIICVPENLGFTESRNRLFQSHLFKITEAV